MSYRGRPSKGCESCRSRKVKCDEAKPVCNRCSKFNHECKYRDQGDLMFRNQTVFAAQKAEDSWRKRAKSHQRTTSASGISHRLSSSTICESPQSSLRRPSPQSETSPEASSSSSIPTLDNLSLSQQIQPDLQRLAYERFVYDFVVFNSPDHDPDTPSSALWNFIPPLYQDAAEGSLLKTIVHAVAYANFSGRCNAPHVQALAEDNLAKGLRLLQKTLSDKGQAPSDQALCSVYLLGVMENLTSPSHNGTFLAHKEGANALIQLRTMEEFYSNPISAQLYEVSYAQMLIGNIHHAKPPNLPMRNYEAAKTFLPTLHNKSGVYVVQLIHKAATLHAQWHEIKARPNPPLSRQDLGKTLVDILDLDSEFQLWEATIPSTWRYQMQRNTPEARSTYEPRWRDLILEGRGAPEEIQSYTTLKKCWFWMFYRTSRLFLLRDQVELLNWMFRLPESTTHHSRSDSKDPAKIPRSLDNVTLSIHHAFATTHLVAVIEKSCSAILGPFTVPIYGKSNEDIVGMRGYTVFWSLGVMDAVLKSGLVPDAGSPPTPPSSTTGSHESPGFSVFPTVCSQPTHNPSTAVPNTQDFSKPTDLQFPYHSPPASDTTPVETPPHSSSALPVDPKPKRKHPFDSKEPHPNDLPSNSQTLDFSITKVPRIDVAARREWIHKLLYYIGTKLGVKKALGIVFAEGYIEISKREVERLFGS